MPLILAQPPATETPASWMPSPSYTHIVTLAHPTSYPKLAKSPPSQHSQQASGAWMHHFLILLFPPMPHPQTNNDKLKNKKTPSVII